MGPGFVLVDADHHYLIELWHTVYDRIDLIVDNVYGEYDGPDISLTKSQAKTLGEALLNWANHGVLQADLIKRKFKL